MKYRNILFTLSFLTCVFTVYNNALANDLNSNQSYEEVDMRWSNLKAYQSKCVSDYDIYVNKEKSILAVRSLVEIDDPETKRKADCRYTLVTNVKKLQEGYINYSNAKIYLDMGHFMTTATSELCNKISRKEILAGALSSAYDGKHRFTPTYIQEVSEERIVFGKPSEVVKSDCNVYIPNYWTHKRLTGED